jgi:hypothetical protein
MAKPRKTRTTPEPEGSVKRLLDALKFCQLAAHSIGQPYQSHIRLDQGRAIAFDGVLAAGMVVPNETSACPHLGQLVSALSRCGEQVGITQVDFERLSVRSGPFKAVVDCIDPASVPPIAPDAPALAVDARLLRALARAALLAADASQEVVTASVWLTSQYAYGTNKAALFRFEHGFNLPGDLVIPKTAINALVKSGKEITHIGASSNSATFWFDDGSWLRTQLYTDPWPTAAVLSILGERTAPTTMPVNFFEAIEAVKPFSPMGNVYFTTSGVCSHNDEAKGAKYDVSDLNPGLCFNSAFLLMFEPHAETIDMHSVSQKLYAFGADFAGVILSKTQS